jgi:uncharacterized protein YfbU (UPF0304 family)
VKLTSYERTTLLNQFRILDKLYKGEYREAVDVFERGFEGEYQTYLATEVAATAEEGDEVREILRMFTQLRTAGSSLRFEGFDGNHEIGHFSHLKHLWRIGSFEDLREDATEGGNAHWPMLATYRRMLGAWSGNESSLTEEVVRQIEEAARRGSTVARSAGASGAHRR